jgi:glycosyltransferase involved in cell wall biosynthesis
MTARPHILFLSQCLPYPPHSGVRSRTFNILRELEREFDVTLLAFTRRNHQPTATAREDAWRALEGTVSHVAAPVPVPAERSRLRFIWDHVRSCVSQEPYTYYEYDSGLFRQQLHSALSRTPPDLVHLDSADLYGWRSELAEAPSTCTHHDIDPLLLRRRAAQTRNMLFSRYLLHQANLVEALERRVCPTFGMNIVMSQLDAARLAQVAPGSPTCVVPNGVDIDYFRPTPNVRPSDDRVVFLGPTYQAANRDAVAYLLADIFPRVRSRRPTVALNLVGDCPDAEMTRYNAQPGVTCFGRVPDVRPHLAGAACSVVPIRVGGGTRLKILDSWAMGKAVVSTPAGCEGLNAVDGENVLVRDTPEGLADAILEVLGDRRLRGRLGAAGRRTVEELYSWRRVGTLLREIYWRLLQPAAVQPAGG